MSFETKSKETDKRERIVRRIARELRDGFYVNLGIGLPLRWNTRRKTVSRKF